MADVVNLTDVDGHFIEEHSYSKSGDGIDLTDLLHGDSNEIHQTSLTNLNHTSDTKETLVINLLKDLTRQLMSERGVPVGVSQEVSQEALGMLSQDQLHSLMTSSSVSYDIVQQIMQIRKQPEMSLKNAQSEAPVDAMAGCPPPGTPTGTPSYDPASMQPYVPTIPGYSPSPTSAVTPPTFPSPITATQHSTMTPPIASPAPPSSSSHPQSINSLVQNILAQSGNLHPSAVTSGPATGTTGSVGTAGGGGNPINQILQSLISTLQQKIQSGEPMDIQQLMTKQFADQQQQQQQQQQQSLHVQEPGGGNNQFQVKRIKQEETKAPSNEVVTCAKENCLNPPVFSEERGPDYCSSECCIQHSKALFSSWLKERKNRSRA